MIKIRILNFHRERRSDSRLVDAAARFAPGIVRIMAEKITAERIRKQLRESGIDAEVSIEPEESPPSR